MARTLGVLVALACSALAMGQTDSERDFKVRIDAATELYKSGKMNDSIVAFECLYAQNPRSSTVQSWLGFLYRRADQSEKAVALLEQA